MRKFIFLAMAVCAVLGGTYLFLFKRTEVVRAAKGYKNADTPQVAADMFKKAIEKRDYDMAAHDDELGRGRRLADILAERRTVAEGVATTRAALDLAARHGVDLPIAAQVRAVLDEGRPPAEAVQDLLGRRLRDE